MPFQRTEQEESQERRIDVWTNAKACNHRKHAMVVVFLSRRLHRIEQFVDVDFFCQDCRVERPFRREIFEDQGLAYTRRFRNFFCGGAVEPFFGEERCGEREMRLA